MEVDGGRFNCNIETEYENHDELHRPCGLQHEVFASIVTLTLLGKVRKSFFSYELLDSFDKLSSISLFSYDSLKMVNLLEEEHHRFQHLLEDGLTVDQALRLMKLKEVPKTGAHNYNELRIIWEENNCQTLLDVLKIYNSQKVQPGCLAVAKMSKFYNDEHIDLFKQCLTAPGVARELVF